MLTIQLIIEVYWLSWLYLLSRVVGVHRTQLSIQLFLATNTHSLRAVHYLFTTCASSGVKLIHWYSSNVSMLIFIALLTFWQLIDSINADSDHIGVTIKSNDTQTHFSFLSNLCTDGRNKVCWLHNNENNDRSKKTKSFEFFINGILMSLIEIRWKKVQLVSKV